MSSKAARCDVKRSAELLMTARLAMLGLLPMALSHGIGSETQKPLAVAIIGGLISATLLTLYVVFANFGVPMKDDDHNAPASPQPAHQNPMRKFLCLILLLIALLIGAAPASHARTPQGRHFTGTIQQADATTCHAVLLTNDKSTSVSFVWNRNTDFVAGTELVSASRVTRGAPVEIIVHRPFFGEPFVTKVIFLDSAKKS